MRPSVLGIAQSAFKAHEYASRKPRVSEQANFICLLKTSFLTLSHTTSSVVSRRARRSSMLCLSRCKFGQCPAGFLIAQIQRARTRDKAWDRRRRGIRRGPVAKLAPALL